MKAKQAHYCFKQEAGSTTHQLYIYDDVSEYGEFDWWTWEYKESETSADFFRKALAEIPETDTIELHINSYGGSVKEGIAIYNQLKQKKCKEIVAYVDGFAYSIASIILQAADRRIMGLGTSLLIHNMWINISGNAEDLRKAADDLDVLMEANRQIYMDKVTITEDELIEMLNNETYLTPDQAVEKGFADEVNKGVEADTAAAMQAMQQQLQQLRRTMTEQKAFRNELMELCKPKQKDKKDDEDEDQTDDDQTDDADNDTDDEDDEDEKNQKDQKKDPKESNRSSLAVLLAQAAQKTILKG
nr:MAG TPA: Putative ATP dependent Clp protease [Caudoviricetes sp.]